MKNRLLRILLRSTDRMLAVAEDMTPAKRPVQEARELIAETLEELEEGQYDA